MKIKDDKYYTPPDLARNLIVKTIRFIGAKNITDIVEPSAGNGSFSKWFKNCRAYDIEPEADGIIKQDFLTLDLPYQKGRLIIGNPPFGNSKGESSSHTKIYRDNEPSCRITFL